MSDRLVRAAMEIFGEYRYEDRDPKRRERKPVQLVLDDPGKRIFVTRAAKTILEAMEEVDASSSKRPRWGYQDVKDVGDMMLKTVDGIGGVIADVATSELDPAWVLQTEPEEVLAVAGAMKACRDLSRMYLKLRIQAINAD